MTFKCNFCERKIPTRYFGDPEVKCLCGATYTKSIVFTLAVKAGPPNP